jgi:hypothetical protein
MAVNVGMNSNSQLHSTKVMYRLAKEQLMLSPLPVEPSFDFLL